MHLQQSSAGNIESNRDLENRRSKTDISTKGRRGGKENDQGTSIHQNIANEAENLQCLGTNVPVSH